MTEEKLITPSGMGATDETRKVRSGWEAMQQGQRMSRQERLIKEQQERAQQIKSGKPLNEDQNYKPGQEDQSGEFSMKRARDHMKTLLEQKKVQKQYKGSADQCILKITSLLGGLKDEDNIRAEKGKILMVEEAGFGLYKVTYMTE